MMVAQVESATTTALIFGEGEDDVAFLRSLIRYLGIDRVSVERYEFTRTDKDGRESKMTGKDAMVPTLKALRVRKGFGRITHLCFTRDCDEEPIVDLMRGMRDALRPESPRQGGLPCPSGPGEIAEEGRLRVGVYLFPGDGDAGCLEDLCIRSFRDDPAWPCIEAFSTCLDRSNLPRPTLKTMISKAKVHTWLASREVADLARVGIAAEKGYVNFTHPAFDPLKSFLRNLFDQPLS